MARLFSHAATAIPLPNGESCLDAVVAFDDVRRFLGSCIRVLDHCVVQRRQQISRRPVDFGRQFVGFEYGSAVFMVACLPLRSGWSENGGTGGG